MLTIEPLQGITKARGMSTVDLLVLLLSSLFWVVYGLGFACIRMASGFGRVVLFLMRGDPLFGPKAGEGGGLGKKLAIGKKDS